MKKLLLGLLLSVGVVIASETPKDDLLSMATMGKAKGTQFEMNKDDMKDADGGYYYSRYINYYRNPGTSNYSGTSRSWIYARAFWGR